jgi:ribosomal-protein-alanine N-acetyltransferase
MIFDCESAASIHGWSREDIAHSIDHHMCFCAKAFGTVIAHCVLSRVADEVELLIFTVAKDWQGKGIGGQFLAAVLTEYSDAKFLLEVRETNAAAMSLYKKLGFIEQGRRKAYYCDTQEDAILFSRQAKSASVTSSQ